MQFFIRRVECKHIIWAGPLVDTASALNTADELRGGTCPTCGGLVRQVDFVGIRKPTATFDVPPAPRNTENRLKKASKAEVKKSREQLARLGARIDDFALELQKAALALTPPHWRGTLSRIPVGILRTYEPNAECIKFTGSTVPAIVVHQGLPGYLFRMNRSIFPLLSIGTMSGEDSRFVEDDKARSALRVQAVDTALEFLGVGGPRSTALVEIPVPVRALEMPLTRTMEAFVLCHEYGHAVLNHADDLRSIGRDDTVHLLERSRAMEFEADTWGQDAVIGAFTGGRNLEPSLAMFDELFADGAPELKQDISHTAPCLTLLYFEFLDVVEERLTRHGIDVTARNALTRRRARLAAKDPTEQSTHPSNQERFQALHAYLSDHSNFTTHTWVSAFETLLDEITGDLDNLIDRTGAVTGKRLTRRFRWPRRKASARPSTWHDPIPRLEDDDDTRMMLETALRNLTTTSPSLPFDQAELRRRFEERENRANEHFRNKEYAEAERIYTRILDEGETDESVPLYFPLGTCRDNLGDIEGAIAAFGRYLELVPRGDFAAMCGFQLGRILLHDKRDPRGAEAALTAAITTDHVDLRAQAMLWLGMIAHERRDTESALRWYRKVYALRDNEFAVLPSVIPRSAYNIGMILQERRQFPEAAKMFRYARDHHAMDPAERALAEQRLRAVRGQ